MTTPTPTPVTAPRTMAASGLPAAGCRPGAARSAALAPTALSSAALPGAPAAGRRRRCRPHPRAAAACRGRRRRRGRFAGGGAADGALPPGAACCRTRRSRRHGGADGAEPLPHAAAAARRARPGAAAAPAATTAAPAARAGRAPTAVAVSAGAAGRADFALLDRDRLRRGGRSACRARRRCVSCSSGDRRARAGRRCRRRPPPSGFDFVDTGDGRSAGAGAAVPQLGSAAHPPFDVHAVRRDFPILSGARQRPAAGLARQRRDHAEAAGGDRPARRTSTSTRTPTSTARRTSWPRARPTPTRARARRSRRFLSAASSRRDRLRARRHRGDQPGRAELGPAAHRRGRRDRHHAPGAPRQHRALAACWPREKGAKLRVDPGRRPRPGAARRVPEAARRADASSSRSRRSRTRSARSRRSQRDGRDGAPRTAPRVLVDGAQAVSHMRVDVQALDADFYVFSGHKVFGPTGIGVALRQARGARRDAALAGRRQHDRRRHLREDRLPAARRRASRPAPATSPTPSAWAPRIDYVERIGIDNIARYEHELLEYATARAAARSRACA